MSSEIKTINGKLNHNGQKMQMQSLEIKDIKPINIQNPFFQNQILKKNKKIKEKKTQLIIKPLNMTLLIVK